MEKLILILILFLTIPLRSMLDPESEAKLKRTFIEAFLDDRDIELQENLLDLMDQGKQEEDTKSISSSEDISEDGRYEVTQLEPQTPMLKRYLCIWQDCGKSFSRKGNSDVHMRTHTGQKPYMCNFEGCGKSFPHKGNLDVHMRTHTGQKPYMCNFEGCGKSFSQKHCLTEHMRRTHTGERPFKCDFEGCGKSFVQKNDLNRHLRTHTGQKPFVCNLEGCGKSFVQKDHLNRHLRTHNKKTHQTI